MIWPLQCLACFYNSHENKLFYLLTMWCIYKIVKGKLPYSRDAALLCVFLMNYKEKSTIYLGCYSADPYPWIWDMFTHRKNDLLTMGKKYNVKIARLRLSCDSYWTITELLNYCTITKTIVLLYYNYVYCTIVL